LLLKAAYLQRVATETAQFDCMSVQSQVLYPTREQIQPWAFCLMRTLACLMCGLLIAPVLVHAEERFHHQNLGRSLAGEPEEQRPVGQPQSAAAPRLAVAPALEVEPPELTNLFWFVLTGGEETPPGTYVLVTGLPGDVTLSGGQANPGRGWVVPLWALEDLKIKVPPGTSGSLDLGVALVDNNGVVLDKRAAEIHIKAPAAVAAREPDAAPPPNETAATTAPPPLRPPAPALVVPPALDAEAAAATRFDVSVGGRPEDLSPGTYVLVTGLPGDVTLSGGQANPGRGWVVPLWALEDLKIKVPPGTSGSLDLGVALVDNNGAVLAERSATVRVTPKVATVPSDSAASRNKTAAPALAQAKRLVEHGERFFAQGNVAEARQYFTRAANLGLAIAHPWHSRHARGR